MAVDDKQRSLESKPELPLAQSGVHGRCEVLRNHDIRRLVVQRQLDVACTSQIRRLDSVLASFQQPEADAGPVVERRPLPAKRGIRRLAAVQHVDVMAHSGEREGQESRCRPDAARAHITEQFVRHQRHPSRSIGHRESDLHMHVC